MEVIDDALAVYLHENSALPCPAEIRRKRGEGEYGRASSDCSDTSPPSGMWRAAAGASFIRIGGVPIYDLDLPDEYLADAWNGRYFYAVSEDLITSTESDDTGVITVTDENASSITTEAAWILLSVGPANQGGYAGKTGNLLRGCISGQADGENCDLNDATFVHAPFNNGDIQASYFDDFIRWETVPRLFNIQFTAGSGGTSLPSCSTGQTLEYDGSDWVCTSSGGAELPSSCTDGQTVSWNGTSNEWECSDSGSTENRCDKCQTTGSVTYVDGGSYSHTHTVPAELSRCYWTITLKGAGGESSADGIGGTGGGIKIEYNSYSGPISSFKFLDGDFEDGGSLYFYGGEAAAISANGTKTLAVAGGGGGAGSINGSCYPENPDGGDGAPRGTNNFTGEEGKSHCGGDGGANNTSTGTTTCSDTSVEGPGGATEADLLVSNAKSKYYVGLGGDGYGAGESGALKSFNGSCWYSGARGGGGGGGGYVSPDVDSYTIIPGAPADSPGSVTIEWSKPDGC